MATVTDVPSASAYDSKIAWYENLGGGDFGTQQVLTTDACRANSVYAADLDGDGAWDGLSASAHDSKFAWYENLGGGAAPLVLAEIEMSEGYLTLSRTFSKKLLLGMGWGKPGISEMLQHSSGQLMVWTGWEYHTPTTHQVQGS